MHMFKPLLEKCSNVFETLMFKVHYNALEYNLLVFGLIALGGDSNTHSNILKVLQVNKPSFLFHELTSQRFRRNIVYICQLILFVGV